MSPNLPVFRGGFLLFSHKAIVPQRRQAVGTGAIYESVIASCHQARRWDEVLRLLGRMMELRLQPGISTLNRAVSACEPGSRWQFALQLLSNTSDGPRPDLVSHNTALAVLARGHEWRRALLLLEEVVRAGFRPSEITFGAAVVACERAACWTRALELMCRALASWRKRKVVSPSRETGPAPPLVALSASVSACGRAGKWEIALQHLHLCETSRIVPSHAAFNAVITACEKRQRWVHALALLQHLRDSKLLPDATGMNAVLSALDKGLQRSKALELLHELRVSRLQADAVSMNAGISACARGQQWISALALFREAQRANLVTAISFNTAIAACSRGRRWQESIQVFQELRLQGYQPDHITFNSIAGALRGRSCWQTSLGLVHALDGLGVIGITGLREVSTCCERFGADRKILFGLLPLLRQRAVLLLRSPVPCRASTDAATEDGHPVAPVIDILSGLGLQSSEEHRAQPAQSQPRVTYRWVSIVPWWSQRRTLG
ncbi:unnamed protein product [Polarella glacialis]|uniref:Pentatricopeptide repeat-containing protein-mitochondrial domain-containing protein n=2 Tax=Polarella glacialis TaxID=89957 RepID=A0A813F445_POLGL|nr:unnamed protein product [Polarella glacialis]